MGLTPRLFLAQYTVLCRSVPRTVAGSSAAAQQQQSTRIAPALLPDPGPPVPTSVGETYKISGQQLGEAICKKRGGAFLTDAMFIHLFLSPVTNGLIIQLSPWNVILHFFQGKDTTSEHLRHSLSPEKRYALDSQTFQLKVL